VCVCVYIYIYMNVFIHICISHFEVVKCLSILIAHALSIFSHTVCYLTTAIYCVEVFNIKYLHSSIHLHGVVLNSKRRLRFHGTVLS
jgi:hypothetical protein